MFGHKPNPSIFDVDLTDAAAGVAGFSVSAMLNDFVVAKMIDNVVPSLQNNHLVRKIVDGGTTVVSAFAYDLVFRTIGLEEWGRWGQFGGTMLGLGRIVTAFIPGYQLSSVTPLDAEIGNVFSKNHPVQQIAQAAQAQQIAAGASATATNTYAPIQGSASPVVGDLY